MLVFDGYDDIVRIPLERIRKVPVKPSHGSAGEDGDEGGDTFTVAPNDTDLQIEMLFRGAPERSIDVANFKAKWREKHGANLVLPKGINLKQFLENAEVAGACRLEMRKMPKGPDSLVVHAPGDGEGDVEGGRETSKDGYSDRRGYLSGDVIDETDFKAKWREKYGTDLVLPFEKGQTDSSNGAKYGDSGGNGFGIGGKDASATPGGGSEYPYFGRKILLRPFTVVLSAFSFYFF